MVEAEHALSGILDDMAMKIMMVEPGDLSQVGDLLEDLEQFLANPDCPAGAPLHTMAEAFKKALEKIIMAELADSPENFERLGQLIALMQEAVRRDAEVPGPVLAEFRSKLEEVGLQMEEGQTAPEEESVTGATVGPPAEHQAPEPSAAVSGQPAAAAPDFTHDKDLIAGFIAESFEHLESIEVNILELEQNPDDLEIINSIFRPFHTIKGVSGFLNLKAINKLAHSTENLLDDVRNDRFPMDSEIIDLVLGVGDFIRAMIQNLKDVLDKGPECYREFDISEYVERILTLQESRIHGEVVPAAPSAEPSSPLSAPPPEPETAVGARPTAAVASAPKPSAARGRKAGVGDAIKVDVEKLDNLVNAVGELVIMQSQVRQHPLVSSITEQKLIRDFSQLARITSDLQKTAMSMRMVPIRQTFQKMIRLVRDLSLKSGKKVDLIMSGEETEIDRNMVDSIYDPLVHMIRNSVDHGVKTPEERQKLGKPAQGTVYLRAYQKGGNMVIEIEDDGQGLDRERIRAKAVERGLIRAEDQLSVHEIENLIFVPGFSTAEKISDVSGRGVGMDVVKKAVEKLRGKVEVSSQPGSGTLFVIRLPLTLAIIDGILVRVGKERFIIPTISIQESIKPTQAMYQTVHGRGEALLIRENLVPIIRLYQVFGLLDPNCTDPCEGIVVVVENEGQQRALLVDELLGKQEVVIKSLGGYMTDIKGVAGGTILGDGRVGLILDLAGLFESSGK